MNFFLYWIQFFCSYMTFEWVNFMLLFWLVPPDSNFAPFCFIELNSEVLKFLYSIPVWLTTLVCVWFSRGKRMAVKRWKILSKNKVSACFLKQRLGCAVIMSLRCVKLHLFDSFLPTSLSYSVTLPLPLSLLLYSCAIAF